MAWSCVLYGESVGRGDSVWGLRWAPSCSGRATGLLFRTKGRRWLVREGGGRCGGVRGAAPPLAPPLKGRDDGIDAPPLKGWGYGIEASPEGGGVMGLTPLP